jgi:hypothetical protein
MWKLPSHLAWDHKPRGIIDEVIDFKKLEDNAKQALNYLWSGWDNEWLNKMLNLYLNFNF